MPNRPFPPCDSVFSAAGITRNPVDLKNPAHGDEKKKTRQACLTLANMAHGNQFAALRLLEAGADKAACDLIRDSDKTRHSNVMEAVGI